MVQRTASTPDRPMAPGKHERWTIPADLERVGPLVLETAGFLERQGVGATPLFKAQLLLEEVVSNVVRHAFRGDRSREVHVQVALDERGIHLVVVDDAPPFDPLRDGPRVDTEAALRDRPVGGLGLHLVKHMADELAYVREGDANRVRMRVNIAAEPA